MLVQRFSGTGSSRLLLHNIKHDNNNYLVLIFLCTALAIGVSAALNELRPCAPISLKHVLAQELIKGLQTVSDSLLRYNTTRMLRDNESGLFLSLCRAFIEVFLLPKWLIIICTFYLCHINGLHTLHLLPHRSHTHIVRPALVVVTLVALLLSWMQRTYTTELAAY